MTKEEFIDGYMERGGTDRAARTPDGYKLGRYIATAVECSCTDADCEGWAMKFDVEGDPCP